MTPLPPPSMPVSSPPPPVGPWQWKNCNVDGCNTNVVMGLSCVVLLVAVACQQVVHAIHRRNVRAFTETAALMVVGGLFNGLYYIVYTAHGHPLKSAFFLAEDATVHDLIYYALLPPIIFEAGFTMRKRKFFANFASILFLAVFGTLIAILVTGGLLFALVQTGSVTDFTFNQLLLWSSLISSTDPIATLSILKVVKAKPPLYDLIFGESALSAFRARAAPEGPALRPPTCA